LIALDNMRQGPFGERPRSGLKKVVI